MQIKESIRYIVISFFINKEGIQFLFHKLFFAEFFCYCSDYHYYAWHFTDVFENEVTALKSL